MTTILEVVAKVQAQAAPVIFLDTCALLDLLKQGRVPAQEISAAAGLMRLAAANPAEVHLVVPELVPYEFADHASKIQAELEKWIKNQDDIQNFLADVGPLVGASLPVPVPVHPLGLHDKIRKLADDFLARAFKLPRDHSCLEKALERLLKKEPPSEGKEIKDSINLEQCLEFSIQLKKAGFLPPRVFVSSDTDFFESSTLHPKLKAEFDAASLEFHTCLRAAVGDLRARGHLP